MPTLSSAQFGSSGGGGDQWPSWGEGPPLPTNSMASTRGGTTGRVTAQHVGGKLVITRVLSGQGVDREFHVQPDDLELAHLAGPYFLRLRGIRCARTFPARLQH